MTDPADRHLEERLHALAHGIGVPVVAVADDVRRGRRRLLRVRVAMAGATTGTLAVVLGITGLTAGDPKATEVPPATVPPTSSPSVPPDSSPSAPAGPEATPDDSDGGEDTGGDALALAGGGPDADDGAGTDTGSQGRVPGAGAPTGATTPDDGDTRGGHGAGHWPLHPPLSDPAQPSTGTPTAAPGPTDAPTGTPTSDPTGTPDPEPTDPPDPPSTTGKPRVVAALVYYAYVLAERLDHGRGELQDFDPAVDPRRTTRHDGRLFAVGTTLRWADGQDPAAVSVDVASGWDQADWRCGVPGSGWTCHLEQDGEVAEHDGLLEVAVEHADGQVVVLATDPEDTSLSSDDLLAAAADERLFLPGDAPVAPPRLDPDTFAAYGEVALVAEGESFTRTALDRAPAVRGTRSVDGEARGTLAWSAAPVYSGGGWECLSGYLSCTEVEVEVDGTTRTVHVARLPRRLGGGWLAQYDGPSYGVRVTSTDRSFPKKRAYLFVTDDDWQPVR